MPQPFLFCFLTGCLSLGGGHCNDTLLQAENWFFMPDLLRLQGTCHIIASAITQI